MGKNGKMRPATLRDARKYGWLPGVSSIVKLEAAPGLVRWQVDQALLSAITLPRNPGESDDDFKARALLDSQQQAEKARDLGTLIHASVQGFFEGKSVPEEHIKHVQGVRNWLAQRYGLSHWEAEASFAHCLGYGGKADLRSRQRQVTLDFKCKDFGPEKTAKDLAFNEHVMQLAAYSDAQGFTNPDCANVFISTRVPGLVVVREWDNDEIAKGRKAFRLLLELWKLRRDYDPSFQQLEAA